ncbi:MAG: redoxin domain-containing protein [Acetobacteraceae bacterium]|nr:redoxin domain-containing protein [Acetobacteraceae bacterium]
MAVETAIRDIVMAADFTLPATDGRILSYAEIAGPKGAVIVFMCNHCPYVKAVLDLMHVQPLPLCEGRARPDDPRCARPRAARHRLRRHL